MVARHSGDKPSNKQRIIGSGINQAKAAATAISKSGMKSALPCLVLRVILKHQALSFGVAGGA